jgi:hypothetical protein
MTKETFDKLVNDDIRAMMKRQVPESFEDWLKSTGDDIGGNWTPDRVQANLDRYDKHPF